MAEIQWIKLYTDFFEDRKIKQIRAMPDGNAILLIWINLLLLAGDVNDGGLIYVTQGVPYTDQALAEELRQPLMTVQVALGAFKYYNMIEETEGGLLISNWEKRQNIDGMERVREQTRERVRKYREKKKEALIGTSELCAYCGNLATTIDHIVPKDRGGADDPKNVVPCCGACNSSKRNRNVVDFLNKSLHLKTQGIDHERVRSNEKLAAFVKWDEGSGRYINVALRNTDVTVQNKNKKEEKEKEYILNAPPQYDTEKRISNTEGAGGEKIKAGEGVNADGRCSGRIDGDCETESGREGSGFGARTETGRTQRRGDKAELLDWHDLSGDRLH